MKNLRKQIESAKTTQELESVVKSIPNQENGQPTPTQITLENAFWYHDLESVEQQKTWMLKRIKATATNRDDFEKNGYSRINLVETTIINAHRLSIIKVDDKEFFVNADGGIVPLSNCN